LWFNVSTIHKTAGKVERPVISKPRPEIIRLGKYETEKENNSTGIPDIGIEVIEENYPPKASSDESSEFGDSIEFSPELNVDLNVKLKIVERIIKRKYYFNPKYYKVNVIKRTICTIDDSITLKLNFNFLLIDVRYLYYMISLIQLYLLKLINKDERDRLLSIVVESLKLKMKYKYGRRIALFSRIENGIETERITLELTSTEFTKEFEHQLTKLDLKYNTHTGFSRKNALNLDSS
jgi:hypothetical protein